MSSFFRPLALSTLLLASPLAAMPADAPAAGAAASVAPDAARESVEQRTTSLHMSLAITAGEEADWNGVTKAMPDADGVFRNFGHENPASHS